ncbi:MAG TPA: hypothetical protein P5205_04175 [Candidatus Paceibacterota bacterium]|nr:hypothetical protein [Verrucomicrobiota bacterium]HSA09546.1 hypothetical protein [Candidatus Paceibacterota bacterium]
MSDTALLHHNTALPRATTEVGAGAPQPELCQVGAYVPGFEGGWCLVRPIPYCPLGFLYGDGYLCRHPEIERIVARTKARKSSAQASKKKPSPRKD